MFLYVVESQSDAQSVIADIPWDGALVGPSFDSSPDSVVVSVGSSAYLGCRVRQLGDRKVSQFALLYCLCTAFLAFVEVFG